MNNYLRKSLNDNMPKREGLEVHEQGGKVQYIFEPSINYQIAYNQSNPVVGIISTSWVFPSIASAFIKIPDDVIVNSVSVRLNLAGTHYYYGSPTVDEWRYAKNIHITYQASYDTFILYGIGTEAIQATNPYKENDITNDVFGIPRIDVPVANPTPWSPINYPGVFEYTETDYGNSYLTNLFNLNKEIAINIFSDDDYGIPSNADFFSPLIFKIIVNGFTKNRL